MGKRTQIGIGLMGLGVVGGGVAQTLIQKRQQLGKQVGCPLNLEKVLVRDIRKKRPLPIDSELLTGDPQDILGNPRIDIVIEVMGGETPASQYIEQALAAGKHVVTANKEAIAKHPELLQTAQRHGVCLLYEASVGGGIPLLLPLQQGLLANDIASIHAIINGTTNYILTRMSADGLSFKAALREAQEKGYAESDPTNDVEGHDAVYKLAILASCAFHTVVRPDEIYCQGITQLEEADFLYARELGYEIKLLAIAKASNGAVEARVHPVLIPADVLLAKVTGVFNAIQVEGDLVGQVLFYGQGAGALPTSSAVLSDAVRAAEEVLRSEGVQKERLPNDSCQVHRVLPVKPISDLEIPFYLRLEIADRPGVLAQIARILGDHSISISSVIQKKADALKQSAEIVIMTHPAREESMHGALARMEELPVVNKVSNFIRVEGR